MGGWVDGRRARAKVRIRRAEQNDDNAQRTIRLKRPSIVAFEYTLSINPSLI